MFGGAAVHYVIVKEHKASAPVAYHLHLNLI